MPRSARLDVPNVLQHVMARGIEGRDIFRDIRDREAFLQRLSKIVTEGKGQLFAWCLMPNHIHLLMRPQEMTLANMMRRLLTGYAVWHNRRHNRKGHLFQNRYKSIIVEEDPYFLELVRYIHLNPVRAGILKTMPRLDRYPYTGHSVILGKQEFLCQDSEWVLGWFGKKRSAARRKYRHFIETGFDQGRRDELCGGGLVRSAAGRQKLMQRSKQDRELADERILGSGSFVTEILQTQEEGGIEKKTNYEEILTQLCEEWRVAREQILSKSRVRRISKARRAFFLRAHEEAGESLTALGRLCGIAHTSVRQAIGKAEQERQKGRLKP
ncbi:MAG: transposase [Desulfobacteraceae bacterium]